MRIKGIFLKDYVAIVQATPDLEWKDFLTEDDWNIINTMVIPTMWYPVETMAHIGRGIFEMRSKGNYEVVRMHGRARAVEAFDEVTMRLLKKNDPVASLRGYSTIAQRYIDGIKVTFLSAEPGRADVLFHPVDDAPAWDLFREIQAGTLEKLAEINGAMEPRAEFIAETREGREACIIRVRWKSPT